MASDEVAKARDALLFSTGSLLESGKYSDMTIRCQEAVFHVHRALVCTRSTVLAAAIDGKFKEAEKSEINLEDDEPEIVEAMLTFLYWGSYHSCGKVGCWHRWGPKNDNKGDWDPPVQDATESEEVIESDDTQTTTVPSPNGWDFGEPPSAEPNNATASSAPETEKPTDHHKLDNPLTFHTKIYVIADKYDIKPLKDYVTAKYEEEIPYWDMLDFVESVKYVYANTMDTDQQLRKIVAKTASQNIALLTPLKGWKKIFEEHVELSLDIIKWQSDQLEKEREEHTQCCMRTIVCGPPSQQFGFLSSRPPTNSNWSNW